MKFKDYEYGWYGFHGTFGGLFMWSEAYHDIKYKDGRKMLGNQYRVTRNNTLKQIQKLSTVRFIYGDYKEVI